MELEKISKDAVREMASEFMARVEGRSEELWSTGSIEVSISRYQFECLAKVLSIGIGAMYQ
jgi:hypothetical protein